VWVTGMGGPGFPFGRAERVQVPAYLPFTLRVHSPGVASLAPLVWEVTEPFAPGERRTLETKRMTVARPIVVTVTGPDGKPLAGRHVRCSRMADVPSFTNEAGVTTCWVSGSGPVDIQVRELVPSAPIRLLAEVKDVQVPDSDEPFEVKIVVPEP